MASVCSLGDQRGGWFRDHVQHCFMKMEKYIALLRGVNVSGKNLIKMAELQQLLAASGLSEVRTYIQSGNIVFGAEDQPCEKLAARIATAIETHFGLKVPVMVVKQEELRQIFQRNPFTGRSELLANRLFLTLLSQNPEAAKAASMAEGNYLPEEYVLQDRVVYLCLPGGYGNTRLDNNFLERKLGVQATTRNLATIQKLLGM